MDYRCRKQIFKSMSLGLLRVVATKRWHTKLGNPGEFKRDNLQRTGKGPENTSRDDAVTTAGPDRTRGGGGVTGTPRETHGQELCPVHVPARKTH